MKSLVLLIGLLMIAAVVVMGINGDIALPSAEPEQVDNSQGSGLDDGSLTNQEIAEIRARNLLHWLP